MLSDDKKEKRIWEMQAAFGEGQSDVNIDAFKTVAAQQAPSLARAQLRRIEASAHKGAIVATWLDEAKWRVDHHLVQV